MSEALMNAVENGNLEKVKALVTDGADLEYRDNTSWTPLLNALLCRQYEIAEWLISQGADIHAKTRIGETALHAAASAGMREFVEWLENQGLDLFAVTKSNKTVLHAASASENRALVEYLLSKGLDVNAKTDSGETALHRAVVFGFIEVAECLITHGADINATDNQGRNALSRAFEHYDSENPNATVKIIELLKQHDAVASDGTALHTNLETFEWLGPKGVESLLDIGLEINTPGGHRGETLFHVAVRKRDVGIKTFEWLIKHGADISAKDNNGDTALHLEAKNRPRKEVIIWFVENGADVNAKNTEGETPLIVATNKGHETIINLLKKHGANK